MAGLLQDRIASNRKALAKGPGGVLQESAPQDLQTLSGQAGLPAPPTDAMSAASLGANQHQQKMMGSPAQVQAAQRIAQDPTQNLATAEREKQARTQATAGEQAKLTKSKDLQDLGGLGDRVNQFIEGQRQKLANMAVSAGQVAVQPAAGLTGLPTDPAQLAALKDAAKTLLTNPNDMNALLTVNKSLGRGMDNVLQPAEVQSLYGQATSMLASAGADVVSNTLNVDDLIAQGNFGYDLPHLASLLNIPETQLGSMNVTQLQQAIDQAAQQEFSSAATTQEQAGSANLGQAERNLAREAGRDISATGIRAAEHDFQRLDQAIQNADQVQFGGKVYRVDDLLRDDTISDIITTYLNSDPATQQQLAQQEPGLVKFINDNQKVLADAAEAIGNGAKQFSDLQQQNAAVGKVQGTQISDKLMKTLVPGYGELSASKLDPSTTSFFQAVAAMPEAQQREFVDTANTLVNRYPGLESELASLSPQELKALELEKGSGSPELRAYDANREMQDQLAHTSANDPDAVIRLMTGDTIDEAARDLSSHRVAKALGLGGELPGMLDEDQDGRIDDTSSLLDRLKKSNPAASLKDAAAGKAIAPQQVQLDPFQAQSPAAQTLIDKLGGAIQDHGEVTGDDLNAGKFNEDELFDIADAGLTKSWAPHLQENLRQQLDRYVQADTYDIIKKFPTPASPPSLAKGQTETLTSGFGASKTTVPSQAGIDSYKKSADSNQKQLDTLKATIQKWQSLGPQSSRKVDLTRLQKYADTIAARIKQYRDAADKYQKQRDNAINLIGSGAPGGFSPG